MLTRLQIKNFKRFGDVDIELGDTVVFIGPNNSGKTTALQALALWDIGLAKWNGKRRESSAEQRTGVTINRRDLISLPTRSADLLWKNLHTREAQIVDKKQRTKNIRIDITVSGEDRGTTWECGLEFDYGNPESFYCRPLRLSSETHPERMTVPAHASNMRVTYMQPMSGLAAAEFKQEPGAINVLLGEGQTAQVLRNLCYRVAESDQWSELCQYTQELFGVKLFKPLYVQERGEITMSYKERSTPKLDIANAGRGLQQTLLLLAYLYTNPHSILLLDEPDSHLEILRQRQIYQIMTVIASKQQSQIIAASHSEVVLEEAAGRDLVIAFVGKPHRIDDRGSQVLKSLAQLGFEQYAQAEQEGWVLYLEGSTDLAILRAFAATLDHEAKEYLERPFVCYVGNQPKKARDHFYGLKEALPNLVGMAIYDRVTAQLQAGNALNEMAWEKCEIENYLCRQEVLIEYAKQGPPDDLFENSQRRREAMTAAIEITTAALSTLRKPDPWSSDIKVTDDFLNPLFKNYSERLGISNPLQKTNYHVLASLVTKDQIDAEIVEKLDSIADSAKRARKPAAE